MTIDSFREAFILPFSVFVKNIFPFYLYVYIFGGAVIFFCSICCFSYSQAQHSWRHSILYMIPAVFIWNVKAACGITADFPVANGMNTLHFLIKREGSRPETVLFMITMQQTIEITRVRKQLHRNSNYFFLTTKFDFEITWKVSGWSAIPARVGT